jgi:hypothetical protein
MSVFPYGLSQPLNNMHYESLGKNLQLLKLFV